MCVAASGAGWFVRCFVSREGACKHDKQEKMLQRGSEWVWRDEWEEAIAEVQFAWRDGEEERLKERR